MGSYTILGRIGEGGMGAVYLGRAPDGRQVAIKVVRPELAQDTGFVARFQDEVANAQRVASFCTAQVLDHGESAGRAYMVTEFIDGLSLKDYVKENGELSPGMLQGVAIGVAAALVAIHAAGLIHRDLKPANVMLSFSGPRVIDFGIARALDVASGLTMTGQLVGSPGWMAPERILQQEVTTAADIFSWGCLVAFAQTGANPFGTGDFSVMSARLIHGEPQVGPLPAPLDRLVRGALDKEPRNRPTARELLLTMVGGESNEAAVLGTLTSWQSPVPLMPQGGAGDAAADRPGLAGPPPGNGVPVAYGSSPGDGSGPGGGSGPGAGSGQPPAQGPPAGVGYTVASGPPAAPERTMAAGQPSAPERTMAAGQPSAPERTAAAEQPGGFRAPERTLAAGGFAGPVQQGYAPGGTKPLGAPETMAASPVESPTMPGRRGTRPPAGAPPYPAGGSSREGGGRGKVILAGAAAVIVAAAAVTGWMLLKPDDKKPPAKTAVAGPAPLPTDKLLVRIDRQTGWPKECYGSIGTLTPTSRAATKVFDNGDKCDMLPHWSPDQKQIAFTRFTAGANELWVMNANGSGPRMITNTMAGRNRVAWSPDGTKIAILAKTGSGPQIAVVTIASPQSPVQLTHDNAQKDDPAWCKGRIAFWSKKNGGIQQIYTVDASTGGNETQVTHAAHNVNDPAFSPDCTQMAYTDEPSTDGRRIWITPADGTGTAKPLTQNDEKPDMDATYSRDGKWIAFARGTTTFQTIWAIRVDGSGTRQLSSGDLGIAHPNWS